MREHFGLRSLPALTLTVIVDFLNHCLPRYPLDSTTSVDTVAEEGTAAVASAAGLGCCTVLVVPRVGFACCTFGFCS